MTDISPCLSHRILLFLLCQDSFCFSITADRHDVCKYILFRETVHFRKRQDDSSGDTNKREKTKRDLQPLFCTAWQYISRRARYPATDRRPSVCGQCRKLSKSLQNNYGVLSRPKERLLSPCPSFRGHSRSIKSCDIS